MSRLLFIGSCVAFIIFTTELLAIDIVLGEPQTDFKAEVPYQSETNGLLYLQHNSVCNQLYLELYIGDTPETLKKVGEIRWFGTISIAIEKGKYWEVRYNKVDYEKFLEDLKIRWTPITGCICD